MNKAGFVLITVAEVYRDYHGHATNAPDVTYGGTQICTKEMYDGITIDQLPSLDSYTSGSMDNLIKISKHLQGFPMCLVTEFQQRATECEEQRSLADEQQTLFTEDSTFYKNVLRAYNRSTNTPRIARNLAFTENMDPDMVERIPGKILWGEDQANRTQSADEPLREGTPLKLTTSTTIHHPFESELKLTLPAERNLRAGQPVIASGRQYLNPLTWNTSLIEIYVDSSDGYGTLIPGHLPRKFQ